MELLSNIPATKYTRASDFIQQIAEATKKLLDTDEAYQTEAGIFLRIKQEEHGKLLGFNLEESFSFAVLLPSPFGLKFFVPYFSIIS